MAQFLKLVMPRIQKGLAQLPQLPRVFALVWAAAPAWTICWGVCLAIQGLLPAAIVYLSRSIVNGVTAAIRNGGAWRDLRSVLLLLAAIAVLALAAELLRGLTVYARTAQSELLADEISSLVHRKSISVDLAFYDSAEFYDHLHRARSEAADRPVALLDNAGSLLQDTITLVAMGAILIRFGLWLPLLLLLGTIPALYVVLRYSLIYQEWWRRTTRERRRAWYYEWLVTTGEVAAELRLFSLGEHFRSSYQSVRARLRTQRLDLARSQSFAELGAGALGLTVTGLATAWMIWRTARGLATLGDLAMFYQAFNQGFGLMRGLLGNLGQFYANLLFLGNLFEFLDLRPKVTDPPQPVQTTAIPATEIRFEDVTFLYPGSNRPALENFSLAIPAGGIVAVVGSNGAGKSTLIKLLCRFYDPEAGRLTVDGIDLREFPVAELRRRITVLFQQPVHYNDTVRENIVYGDFVESADEASVEAATRAAGAESIVSRLPKGYDSVLGRMFAEGAELSVGEWQRIALARAFLRKAPILVLDEPTSAMDPWAEADWLARFRELATGRTVLIITHRFSTAMFADRIHVMSEGRIVESGTHEWLLAQDGRYAQAWLAQRKGR